MRDKIVIPADKVWDARKPKYNGYAVGHGPHRNKKAYNRKRKHRDKDLEEGLLALIMGGIPMLIFMIGFFMEG